MRRLQVKISQFNTNMKIKQFAKRPEIVKAFRWDGDINDPDIKDFLQPDFYIEHLGESICKKCGGLQSIHIIINTNKFTCLKDNEVIFGIELRSFRVCPGEYVCEDAAGRWFKVRKEVFEALYQPTPEYKDA